MERDCYDQERAEPISSDTSGNLALSWRFQMFRQRNTSEASERGAVLVHVAFAFIALLAFSTFVVDYGVFWLARRQAQNAADAGALSAAMYMAWDGDQAGAQTQAVEVAQLNLVYGQVPDITTADVTFPTCPAWAPGPVDTCVRVDAFRNQRPNGSPLPIFFGSLLGLTAQGIQATATAQILFPASSDCVKPFAIPDKWNETDGVDSDGDGDNWDPTDRFERYDKSGNLLPNPDSYLRPTYDANGNMTDAGSGYTLEDDYGLELTLKSENQQNIAPGWSLSRSHRPWLQGRQLLSRRHCDLQRDPHQPASAPAE